jgi:YesN/AraC family two-component response regulator
MAQPFDLLITDFKMPQIDGLTLIKHIRKLRPETVIVMLTAFEERSLRDYTASIFIHHLLSKPIKIPDIRRVIKAALAEIKPVEC